MSIYQNVRASCVCHVLEMLKLQRGLGVVNDDGSIWFPHIPDPDADGPVNDEEEEV